MSAVRLALAVPLLVATGGWVCLAESAAVGRPDSAAMRQRIDDLLAESWQRAAVQPAPAAGDAEFLRRAYLDLTGRIPPVRAVRDFLADTAKDKRARLIDELLAHPHHATHLANTWRDILLPQGADPRQFGGLPLFQNWLRDRFAENVPYDEIVGELLLAKGQYNQSGPVLFYTMLRAQPEELAAATSRSLLGVQIQCAQCHDHPFDQWSQRDFWGYAAFFARLQRPANQQAFVFNVQDAAEGEVNMPETGEVVPPRFLGGEVAADKHDATRREQLAAWLTSKENPYFARAAVNRVWAMMFGRGLVDPVDDLGRHNPPSHPRLMNELASYFAAIGFDVRQLVRTLAGTRAYQLSSAGRSGSAPPPESFAQMAIKNLTADQLYDCLADATLRRPTQNPQQRFFGGAQDQNRRAFVEKFRAPAGRATEYQAGIPQALTLMNGRLVADATDLEKSDLLVSLQAPLFTDEERVETLFLATLSRPPQGTERSKFVGYVTSHTSAADRRRALSDVLWALLNSAEFTLNH